MYSVYIKSNYNQKLILNLVLFQDYLYTNDRTFHNLPVQVLGSMQHVVTKDKLACFLDTQPIPDLVVYETECTEHPTLSIDAEYAGDVVSLCTRSAKTATPCHQVCGEMLIPSAEK